MRRRQAAGGSAGPIRILPAAVAVPRDEEDVASLVAWAAREGLPLVPRGTGTGMPGGNVGWGVVVDLCRLVSLDVTQVAHGRLLAGAGVVGSALEEAARAGGFFFPPLPSSAPRCTVGGMVANNAAGVRSFRHGASHAWVESLEVVLPDGSLVSLPRGADAPPFRRVRHEILQSLPSSVLRWPQVRKNSSGYALDRFLGTGDPVDLLVGSEGTLGIVTRVGIRLAPRPDSQAVVVLPVPNEAALDHVASSARAVGAAACEFLGRRFLDVAGLRRSSELSPLAGSHAALVILQLEGTREEVHSGLDGVRRLAAELGVGVRVGRTDEEAAHLWDMRHLASPVVAAKAREGLVSMQFIEDSVVPDGRLSAYLSGLGEILRDEETDSVVFGHAGDGNVHVNPLVDVRRADWQERVRRILERTVDLVGALGGTLAGEHGDGRIRAPFHTRIFGARLAAAFSQVKAFIDPQGTLNPGVVIAEAGQDPLAGLSPKRGRR